MVRDIHRLVPGGVEYVDGKIEEYESIILATGYRTNITSWLKVHTLRTFYCNTFLHFCLNSFSGIDHIFSPLIKQG